MSQPAIISDYLDIPWRVDEVRQTAHGWAVYFGRPVLPDGRCWEQRGNTVIVTAELRHHLAATVARPKSADLPLSGQTLAKLRRQLGLRWRDFRRKWCAERAEDLATLTEDAFAGKHGIRQSTVSMKLKAAGRLRWPRRWDTEPATAALLASHRSHGGLARQLGVSATTFARWRKLLRNRPVW
jgi:hypothetical protein